MDALSPSNLMISPTNLSQPTFTNSNILAPAILSATTTIILNNKLTWSCHFKHSTKTTLFFL